MVCTPKELLVNFLRKSHSLSKASISSAHIGIILNWEFIVGKDVADKSIPVTVVCDASGMRKLILRVNNRCYHVEIAYLERSICSKVNAYLGSRYVDSVVVRTKNSGKN